MAGTSESTNTTADTEKEEVAKKAKQKFLENLRKFQIKATESKSSFQRSYRGPSEIQNGSTNNFRRSLRPTSTRAKLDSINSTRRSLRSRRLGTGLNSQAENKDISKPVTSAVGLDSSTSPQKLPTCTEHDPLQSESTEPARISLCRISPESHSSKVSSQVGLRNRNGTGDVQLRASSELRDESPPRPSLSERHDDRSSIIRKKRDSEKSISEKPISQTGCIETELVNFEQDNNTFESGNIKSPTFIRKSHLRSSIRSRSFPKSRESNVNPASASVPHPDKLSNSSSLANNRLTKPRKQLTSPSEADQLSCKLKRNELREDFSKSNRNHERGRTSRTLAEKTVPEKYPSLQVDEEADVAFNAEEAIDTLKRLSLEIDAIKHIGFRRSITSPSRPPKATTSATPEFASLGQNTLESETVSGPTAASSSLSKSKPQAEDMMSEKIYLPGKEKLQKITARDKREKQEREDLKKSRESASKNSTNGHESRKSSALMSASLNDQKSTEQSEGQPQSSFADHSQAFRSADSSKPASLPRGTNVQLQADDVAAKSDFKTKPISVKGSAASNTGSMVNFRKLTVAQRRDKLRKVVLKHKDNLLSDSELSFSDDSSLSSDIDMDWLEEGDTEGSVLSDASRKTARASSKMKSKPPQNSSPSVGDSETNRESPQPPQTSVGNMMSMWETKVAASSKPTRQTPVLELGEVRGKLNGAKAVWETPENLTPTPTPISHQRRMSFENENVVNGSDAEEERQSRDVGSMRSMWESKLDKKPAPINDEGGRVVVGKLKVAKDLFENVSKRADDEKTNENPGRVSPAPIFVSSISDMKSLFENKLDRRSNHLAAKTQKSGSNKPTPHLKQTIKNSSPLGYVSSDSKRNKDEEKGWKIDLSSHSSYSSDEEFNSVRHSTCRQLKHTSAVQKTSTLNTMETSSDDALSSFKQQTHKSSKSNIQNKISARRKRSRRPMTQPVTVDDVTSAKVLMKKHESSSDQSPEDDQSSLEEKELSFSERLAFFNQLVSKPVADPKKGRFKTQRGSLKRHFTQPVDRDALEQARELYSNKEASGQNYLSAFEDSAGDSNKLLLKKEVDSLAAGKIVRPTSEIESDKSFNDQAEDKRTKVGKLSSELRLKFSENRKQIEASVNPRASTPSSQSTEFSETSSSPLSTPHRLRSSERLSSPFSESKVNNLHLEELLSGGPDMGRNREVEIKATGSIHERLKLLEKNKEEGWKKRLKGDKKVVKSSLEDRMSKLNEKEDKWKKNKDSDTISPRSASGNKANISDRLNSIMANSESWKSKRGKQNDATQFTTEAKIAQRDGHKITSLSSSSSVKRKALPTAVSDRPVVTIDDVSSDQPGLNKLSEVLKLSQKGLEPEVIKKISGTTTEIPDLVDAGFEDFFTAATSPVDEPEKTMSNGVSHSDSEESATLEAPAWLDEDHLDQGGSNLSDIGRLKANLKRPSVRSKRSTRNPVKALAARTDIKQSYTEQRSNVTKLEQQRIASVHGNAARFTNAALAGLAHKADFSKVNLRSTKKTSAFSASDHKPWREKMLLRVKGRRHVQTRLVAPSAASLNSGDAYLLILPQQLFAWFGEYSNVIEKAKVQEIADYIIHKGDMGSKATSLITIKEETSSSIRAKEFWNHLGGKSDFEPSGGTEEDELYEVNTEAAVKSYKLEDSKLIPHKSSWGKLPTMGQLSPTSTFVFDFGAEMYIWHGKEVSFDDRQCAIKLARALWNQGYDYTELGFCPFSPISKSSTDLKGERPEWGLFARVNENLETALVQEKFEDWSNIAREIGDRDEVLRETSRGQVASEMKVKTNITPDMTSCDVEEMHSHVASTPRLILEGHNVWKGHGLMYDDDGRGLEIHTSSVDVWHASDSAINLLDEADRGVFHRCESYVVRWRYIVSSTGKWKVEKATENLKSDPKGRERVSYFLWTGTGSSINEKGASALMATEIDKDGGPQKNIAEGKEPPAFTQCFEGGMVVTDGKKGSREGFYSWKLFCVRGSDKRETVLYQVPCNVSSLRSRNSFVALQGRSGKLVVWHGAKSPEKCREMAESAASKIQEDKRSCLGFRITCKSVTVTICEEEKENEDFIDAVGRVRRNKYASLTDSKPDPMPCPRAWHFLSTSDQFVAKELDHVAVTEDDVGVVTNCFPITQQQLKDLAKPAVVLLENWEGLYLWLSVVDGELTGSSKRQYDISRRLAMETTTEYCKKFRPKVTPMIIQEYHEPLEFTNSFLSWKEPEKKLSFDERRANKPRPIADILKTISRLTYSLEELRATPLPEGVDPNHLETYLSAADFVGLFEMSKDEFYSLPPWKQQKIRKEKNLF